MAHTCWRDRAAGQRGFTREAEDGPAAGPEVDGCTSKTVSNKMLGTVLLPREPDSDVRCVGGCGLLSAVLGAKTSYTDAGCGRGLESCLFSLFSEVTSGLATSAPHLQSPRTVDSREKQFRLKQRYSETWHCIWWVRSAVPTSLAELPGWSDYRGVIVPNSIHLGASSVDSKLSTFKDVVRQSFVSTLWLQLDHTIDRRYKG